MGIYANDVQKLYIAYFNRPADPVGLAYWEEQIEKNGGSTAAIANAFSASAEYKALFDGKTSAQIVETIYQNLFGRSAEPTGLTYWAVRLENGTFNVGNIAVSIMVGAQNDDKKVIDNKTVVATEFTTALDTTAEILAYSGTTAAEAARTFLKTVGSTDASLTAAKAAVATTVASISSTTVANGSTFTLTTGIDPVVGAAANDTINGVVSATAGESTMTLADNVNGGAGTDTFNLTVSGNVAMAASEISAVEVFNIKNLTGAATAHDFSNVTGETAVWNRSSTANVEVTGVDAATIGVASTTTNMTATFKASSYAAGSTVSLAVDGAGSATTDSTITVGQATAAGAATSVAIAASGTSYITLDAGANALSAANGIKTLTVTGSGKVDIDNTSDLDNDAVLTLGGTLTKVDASANTGGVTIQVANADVAVSGGSGADVITLANTGALTDKASVSLGDGNDSLLNNGSAGVGTKAVLDGGAGTDTVASTLLEVANQANIKGWEVLDLKGETRTIDASLFTGSTFESLALTGALGGATTVQKLAGTGLKLDLIASGATSYGTLTATLANAATGTADSATVTFANKSTTAVADDIAALTSNGLETVSFVSGGVAAAGTGNTVTNFEDKANSLTKISISGAKEFVLSDVDVNTAEIAASAKSTAAVLTTIDASAATGKVTITAGGDDVVGNVTTTYTGLTIKAGSGGSVITNNAKNGVVTGGAGDDTITVAGSGATVDTGVAKTATGDVVNVNGANASLTLGTGLQTVNVQAGAAAAATLDKLTTVTSAAKGDIIDFTAILAGTDANVDAITKVNTQIGAASSLTEALNLAANVGGVEADGSIVFFNWVDGNTYLVADAAGLAAGGLVAADAVVKLVGTFETFTATNGIVTLG